MQLSPMAHPLFPYTTLFRSEASGALTIVTAAPTPTISYNWVMSLDRIRVHQRQYPIIRAEVYTPELQSPQDTVSGSLLDKNKETGGPGPGGAHDEVRLGAHQ